MISLLVLATLGQYRQCVTAVQYRVQQPYQQAQTYNNAYVYNEKAAFVAVESAEDLLRDYGGLVGQEARYEQRAQQVQRSQQDLSAKIDRLTQIVESLRQRPAQDAPEPELPQKGDVLRSTSSSAANYVPSSEAAPLPPTIAEVTQTSAHAEKARTILTQHCARCHTSPSSSGGGNSIFNTDGSLARLEPEDLLLIDQQVYSGAMPKGGIPLTSQEYSAIRAWIDESRDRISLTLKNSRGKKS